jgi:putative pyruvate formate lyase activating enzyme
LCRVNRPGGQLGYCGIGQAARVASAGAHFGEERVLVGKGGSGAIFFQGCNLKCVFCQNFDIACNSAGGQELSPEQLARLMLRLQREACGNVNLVTPSHVGPQVLEAIMLARRQGLRLPIVYNSSGYDSVEMLGLLAGWIDVYMPDFKYASAQAGKKYSHVEDYPGVARAALAEMYRQVGRLELDQGGLARRGLLVRHLVMPLNLADSSKVVDLVAQIAPGCAINVMGQYRPTYRAAEFPELLVLPTAAEITALRERAAGRGLLRVD